MEATAPTQEDIYSNTPEPPNHPHVTASQYYKKLVDMGFGDDAQADDIQKVADALDIPFDYAFKLQHEVDNIINNAHVASQITSGTSKRTQPYKGGRKSRRYGKKSGRKSRRHSKKSRKSRR